MRRMIRNLVRVAVLVSLVPALPAPVPAAVPANAATPRGSDDAALRKEREERTVQRLREDLRTLIAAADGEIADLDRRIDAVLPLESPRRERGLRDLRERYRDYRERLALIDTEVESDLAAPPDPRHPASRAAERYGEALRVVREFGKALGAAVKSLDRDLQSLVRLLDRKQSLADQLDSLQERLDRIEERLQGGGKGDDFRKRDELRGKVRHLQDELRSLADVDEDLPKHFALLIEEGKLETEWLAGAAERFEELRKNGFPAATVGSPAAVTARYRDESRFCEAESRRIERLRDDLGTRRERLSSAGTLRDLDRSRDFDDLYDRFTDRYDREAARLRLRAGDYEAELAEFSSRGR